MARPPAPHSFVVAADERVARVSWNGFPISPSTNPPGVSGYLVEWGELGEPMTQRLLTTEPLVQIEPLLIGRQYQAYIRALDAEGRFSATGTTITFHPDPARIAGLRASMTGFFDDFDQPAGMFDTSKWNIAWSMNNDPARNGFFITPRNHAHTTLATMYADRGQAVARPHAPFDFTDRVGTLVFDFDGVLRRDHWYLDLMPERLDITGHAHAGNNEAGTPVNMLRFRQSGNAVEIVFIGANGRENVLANSGISLMDHGVQLVKHVRQPWRITVSKTHAAVWINERRVVQANLDLPFEKAWVHFSLFSYNTPKSNFEQSMADWDNFGFDGPAPLYRTHSHLTAVATGAEYRDLRDGQPQTMIVRVPPGGLGAAQARLHFTMQMMPFDSYAWSSDDRVFINGHAITIPEPVAGGLRGTQAVSMIMPWSVVLPVAPAWLVPGDNEIEFRMLKSGVANLRIELDYPVGSVPSYTRPEVAWGSPPVPEPEAIPVGPNITLDRVNTHASWLFMSGPYQPPPSPHLAVNGLIEFEVFVGEILRLNALGNHAGVSRVEMWVDDRVVESRRTDIEHATPGGVYLFYLNSNLLGNGERRVAFRAYNRLGQPSVPDHFESSGKTGQIRPAHLLVQNAELSFSQWQALALSNGYTAPGFINYALGHHPAAHLGTTEPLVYVEDNSLHLRFNRARSHATYTVQASNDLVTWVNLVTNPGAVAETVVVRDSVRNPERRFLRLRVAQP